MRRIELRVRGKLEGIIHHIIRTEKNKEINKLTTRAFVQMKFYVIY
jgi:hypothetical protein